LLSQIIELSLRHRALVILGVLALATGGAVSLGYLDIDAFPDTTPVQVQINTTAPALGPEEVEQRITFPIEQGAGRGPSCSSVSSSVPRVRLRGQHRHLLRATVGNELPGQAPPGWAAKDGAATGWAKSALHRRRRAPSRDLARSTIG
jgi:hypothetical protein